MNHCASALAAATPRLLQAVVVINPHLAAGKRMFNHSGGGGRRCLLHALSTAMQKWRPLRPWSTSPCGRCCLKRNWESAGSSQRHGDAGRPPPVEAGPPHQPAGRAPAHHSAASAPGGVARCLHSPGAAAVNPGSPPVQGTSVTDLDDRLKALDRKVADELQALWPLRVSAAAAAAAARAACAASRALCRPAFAAPARPPQGVDVQGELTAARASI